MLKIRYNLQTGILSGWTDNPSEYDTLLPRAGEKTTELDMVKPGPSDDYEYWCYDGSTLTRSNKPVPIPKPILEPLVFTASPPGEAIGERLLNIENFLKEAYPE